MKTLKFIDIRRIYGYGGQKEEDKCALTIHGRIATPGCLTVIGGLGHCQEFRPETEKDRLALIDWLESAELRAAISK